MARPISTRMHGMVDYLTGGTLLALPGMLGAKGTTATVLRAAGAGALAYSLLTRYELGLIKILPMRLHLLLDAMSGATLAAAPFLFADEDSSVTGVMAGIGAFEIAASLLTKTQPPFAERAQESGAVNDTVKEMRALMERIKVGAAEAAG